MCGCNIGKMARKRRISGLSDAGSIAMNLAPIAVGVLLGKIIEKKVLTDEAGVVNENSNLLKLGIGILGASFTKGMISQLAMGVAVDGAVEFVAPSLKKSGMINLLPPAYPSRWVAGVPQEMILPGGTIGF